MRPHSRFASVLTEGWWVLFPAVVLTAVAVLLLRGPGHRPGGGAPVGDGRGVASYGFPLSPCLVDREDLAPSGMPRDGLPALIDPLTMAAQEIDLRNREERGKLLVPGDRIAGLVVGGVARAYPLRLLRWHEVVNDTLAGLPVLVTYNPLCDSVVAAVRSAGDEIMVFGSSGLVLDSNLLLYDRHSDRASEGLWSQIDARCVCGPCAGAQLPVLPVEVSSWGDWLRRHPRSTVLAPSPEHASRYRRDPYHSYFGSDLLRFPVSPLPPAEAGLALKDRVVIVDLDGHRGVFALDRLAAAAGTSSGAWTARLGGLPVTLRFDLELGATRVDVGDATHHSLAVRHAFWFAWYAGHPDSELLPRL